MAAVDDLADGYAALASTIEGVDAESVVGSTSEVADQFAALGASDPIAALATATENAEKVQELLRQAAAVANETAAMLRGLT